MQIHVVEDINVPPERAFDLMADVRNEETWNNQVSETSLESPEPIGQGARFRTVNRGRPYTGTITEYQRPQRLVFDVTGDQMDIQGQMRFTPMTDGTRLEADFDMAPKGFMKVMFPVMAPLVRRDFPKQIASFKRFCESSTGHAGTSGQG